MASKKPRSGEKSAGSIEESLIAVRAFERWMGRGCPVSDGIEDWIAARGELEAEFATRMPRSPKAKAQKAAASPASMH